MHSNDTENFQTTPTSLTEWYRVVVLISDTKVYSAK